jgi:hypothetical protein
MIFYQSSRLVEFVEECVRSMTPPFKSLIDDVHEFRLKPIRDLNSDLIERDVAISSGDDPGTLAKYSFITRIPVRATFGVIHSWFRYTGQGAGHAAEKTVQTPPPASV